MRLSRTAARRLVLAAAGAAVLGAVLTAGAAAWAWRRWGPTVYVRWGGGRMVVGARLDVAPRLRPLLLPAAPPAGGAPQRLRHPGRTD